MFFTVDGGASWQPEHGARDTFKSVAFFDGQFGVAVGWPTTLWTRDGGRSWIEVENGLSLNHADFFKTGRALAVGYRGVIVLAP